MSDLLEHFEDGVLTLTLNRPEVRNCLTPQLSYALTDAARRAAEDLSVRCVVLTGAGNTFCAGGDVSAFPIAGAGNENPPLPKEPQVQFFRRIAEASRLFHEMPKPTLAIIPGACVGAGLSLAMSCDLRFCLDSAKLTTAFSRMGVSGDCGGSYFLSKILGSAKARELYFMSDVITGSEAHEIGMVTKVASRETFDEESRAFATHLATLPTAAIGLMKKNMNAADDNTLSDAFDVEAASMAFSTETQDHKRAVSAFLNKQSVVFEGY